MKRTMIAVGVILFMVATIGLVSGATWQELHDAELKTMPAWPSWQQQHDAELKTLPKWSTWQELHDAALK